MTTADVNAMLQQADGALRRGEHGTVRRICARVLQLQPNHHGAVLLLGLAEHFSGRSRQAVEHLQQAAQQDAENPEIRFRLAQALTMVGRYDDALTEFDEALRIDPEMRQASAEKAAVYERQNRFEDSRAQLQPLIARPDCPLTAASVNVRVLTALGEVNAAVEFGRGVSIAAHEPAVNVAEFKLALARAYEKAGQPAEALAAAEQAHERFHVAFQPNRIRRLVDDLMQTFTPEFIEAAPRPAMPNDQPVFVVGMPRCGSTLVERIIDSHPDAAGAGELRAMANLVSKLPQLIGSDKPFPQCAVDITAEHAQQLSGWYVELLRAESGRPNATRIVDKMLNNLFTIGLISVLFPGSRVIWVRRDALNNCLAIYLEHLLPANIPYAATFSHLGFSYREHERMMHHWQQSGGIPILEVQYEQLVSEPEAQTRRLIEFCGLPWDDACLSFHQSRRPVLTRSFAQVTSPIYQSSVNRATQFGALLDPLREALADPDAAAE